MRLAFPLQHGWYYVGQGGGSTLINHHHPITSQRYALDIVELNAFGMRASGVYPRDLERYAIFRATVHGPCDGIVVSTEDGLPNHTPPATDREDPAGNHVVIACHGVHVLLAHLDTGSVRVGPGDPVTTGQPLGSVGNSGNTSEPHLHIHAVRPGHGEPWEGESVPMLFDDRFAVRNTTFD